MNVIELLTQDHEKILDLFEQFDELKEEPEKNRGKLEKLYSKIKFEIEMHMTAEEQFFYPELSNEEDTHELVLKSLKEHQAVKALISELDEERVDESWVNKMSVMKNSVQYHITDEENELFEKAVEILDEDEINEIGESINELKKAA